MSYLIQHNRIVKGKVVKLNPPATISGKKVFARFDGRMYKVLPNGQVVRHTINIKSDPWD